MTALVSRSCEEFIELLASKEPVPGGGGAAALVAALGTALGGMVASLTIGKPRHADVEQEVIRLKAGADSLQARLLALVARDAEVFGPLSRAYGLPKDNVEERAIRDEVMEACLRECCEVPLEIMECCCEALELHEGFARTGAAIAISDVGCGVACCRAALEAASLNVFINTMSMRDRSVAESYNERAHEMCAIYGAKADVLFEDVAKRLGQERGQGFGQGNFHQRK
jgi:formiminotetrahydrofolate cyclodeaminase